MTWKYFKDSFIRPIPSVIQLLNGINSILLRHLKKTFYINHYCPLKIDVVKNLLETGSEY